MDTKGLGFILLIVGIILLVAGILTITSSVGLASNQQDGSYNAFSAGTERFLIGLVIGIIGVVFIAGGAFVLFRG